VARSGLKWRAQPTAGARTGPGQPEPRGSGMTGFAFYWPTRGSRVGAADRGSVRRADPRPAGRRGALTRGIPLSRGFSSDSMKPLTSADTRTLYCRQTKSASMGGSCRDLDYKCASSHNFYIISASYGARVSRSCELALCLYLELGHSSRNFRCGSRLRRSGGLKIREKPSVASKSPLT
jgi:hypothetical protein